MHASNDLFLLIQTQYTILMNILIYFIELCVNKKRSIKYVTIFISLGY